MLGIEWSQRSSHVATEMVNCWWAGYKEDSTRQKPPSWCPGVRSRRSRPARSRVSREEPHYLELATLEHKLLQISPGLSLHLT
ncbi:hypothetical protein NHX12_030116 [Muraenolepis orangiensis]|uniref:Uncharacterized protein n=1 Tax=Muraenolepis orangiensis TaxID=630683 RepID=A0A9Q0EB43_9TELE|nr:hypothetical protein NHX12_030116 [Muraenolepis orangiensis]